MARADGADVTGITPASCRTMTSRRVYLGRLHAHEQAALANSMQHAGQYATRARARARRQTATRKDIRFIEACHRERQRVRNGRPPFRCETGEQELDDLIFDITSSKIIISETPIGSLALQLRNDGSMKLHKLDPAILYVLYVEFAFSTIQEYNLHVRFR